MTLKNHLLSWIVSACLIATTSALCQAPEKSSRLAAWEWLRDNNNKKRPAAEVMAHYEKNKEALSSVPKSKEKSYVTAAFRLAEAAFELKQPTFQSLLEMAEAASARDAVAGIYNVAKPAVMAHHDLLQATAFAGEFELAFRIADKATARWQTFKESPPKDSSPIGDDRFDVSQAMTIRSIMRSLGDYEGLERQLRWEISEQQARGVQMRKALEKAGVKNPSLSSMTGMLATMHLSELAEVVARQGRIDEAVQILSAYDAEQKSEGKNDIAKTMNGFLGGARSAKDGIHKAEVWLMAGKPDQALKELDIALSGQKKFVRLLGGADQGKQNRLAEYEKVSNAKLLGAKSRSLWMLGRVDEALETDEAVLKAKADLPDTHPDVISSRQMRAWALFATGKTQEAKDAARIIADDQYETIDQLLRFASVRQRMTYLQQADPFSLLVAAGDIGKLTESVIRLKGVVLDSVLEEQRFLRDEGDTKAVELRQKLESLRKEHDTASAGGQGDTESLRQQIEDAESKLASLSSSKIQARESLSVTEERIKSVLNPDDVLVEFIRYRKLEQKKTWVPHYGALVISPMHATAWIPLGAAEEIEMKIHALLDQMNGAAASKGDAELEVDLKTLHARLLQPLADSTGNARRLIIAPDGDLGRLSFAILMKPDGSFACEQSSLVYVSTARDLLRSDSAPADGPRDMVIVADPDYNLDGNAGADTIPSRRGIAVFDRNRLPKFGPLPSTRIEMEHLRSVAEKAGFQVHNYAGSSAQEQVLHSMKTSPKVLHLATHGMVLPLAPVVRFAARGDSRGGILESATAAASAGGPISLAISDDVLQRSMLAFCGANNTFTCWKAGQVPPTANDGLLTAAEVAALDLSSTWLSVLSACETAAGETLSGEGVMGMRRGFFIAGVDHLVMTFWSIADEETVEVMADFYQDLFTKAHPAAALHRAQRDALVKWRKEKGLVLAVIHAGPFALSTSGKLPPP